MKIILAHDPETGATTITSEGLAGTSPVPAIEMCLHALVFLIQEAADGTPPLLRKLTEAAVGVLFESIHDEEAPTDA